MARLRLFAAAREAAGVSSVEIEGRTVGEVLDRARTTYGTGFAAVLETCAIWRNGEPTELSEMSDPGDEIAVLPPVSGG